MRYLRIILIALLVLVGFIVLQYHQLIFSGLILGRGDTFSYFYPYWGIRNASIQAGQIPLWANEIMMGVPLLANPQIGLFYPPNWLSFGSNAPDAIRVSIILHLIWGGMGVFTLMRRSLYTGIAASLGSALLFMMGGYMGSHVEQINQLQGLVWMPWIFYFLHRMMRKRRVLLNASLLSMALALQLFTGHTQTVFITGFGLLVYGLLYAWRIGKAEPTSSAFKQMVIIGFSLGIVVVLALALASPQLIPTMELTGLSNRSGGLNPQEATAFSLPFSYIGQSLLPNYEARLFGEYTAYIGIFGLALSIVGILTEIPNKKELPLAGISFQSRIHSRYIWITLLIIGLLFAFGRFNPLYVVLAHLPGFNLFRVPARWLALVALSLSVLAGIGIDGLTHEIRLDWRRGWIVIVGIGSFILLTRFVLQVDPVDISGDAIPSNLSFSLWIVTLILSILVMSYAQKRRTQQQNQLYGLVIVGLIGLELVLASSMMPYQDLVPREVYEGQRLTESQLLALKPEKEAMGRILAISALAFEPGDQKRLVAAYEALGMDEKAIRNALVGIKKQEVIYPNLPLHWRLYSVDGFGGGVLPTEAYTQFTSLILPENSLRTSDGRLGEILARSACEPNCIPDEKWLDLMAVEYLILDKVGDIWQEGVAFDTAFVRSQAEWFSPVAFESTELQLLIKSSSKVPELRVKNKQGQAIKLEESERMPLDNYDLIAYTLPDIDSIQSVNFESAGFIYAVSLVDKRSGDFQQLVPEGYERILSSDVKLYRRVSAPHAFVAYQSLAFGSSWDDFEQALNHMQSEEFNVQQDVIIHGASSDTHQSGSYEIEYKRYEASEIALEVSSDQAGWLVLKDAYYPGWKAWVDGIEQDIYPADVLFRAIPISAGEGQQIILRFEPDLWRTSALLGVGVWLVMGVLSLIFYWKRR